MTAEVMDQTTSAHLPEAEPLEMFLLTILEGHDGLCLDNEIERGASAAALAAALLAAVGDGTRDFPWPASSERGQGSEPPHPYAPETASTSGK